MNPLFRAASDTATLGWLMGVMTAVFILFFMGWVWWAWHPRNRRRMEEAAAMPLELDGRSDA